MIVVDSSVAVAAALPEHEAHDHVLAAVPGGKTRAIAHVAIETFSVLTRLPRSLRISGTDAIAYLRGAFEFPPLVLAAKRHFELLELAAAEGIGGGAVYDLIVGATAADAGATLLTRDRRAAAAYDQVGATYRLA